MENPSPLEPQPIPRSGFPWKPAAGIVAALWVLLFLAYFLSLGLPNNKNFPRTSVLSLTPDLLLDLVSPREPAGAKVGWKYLPQRLDLAWVSAVILLGAWGIGSLALRSLRLRGKLTPLEFFVFACGAGLTITSLIVLTCGLAGLLSRPVHLTWMVAALLGEVFLRVREW